MWHESSGILTPGGQYPKMIPAGFVINRTALVFLRVSKGISPILCKFGYGAFRWGKMVKNGRRIDDLVSLTDLAPTILEATGLEAPPEITGKSLIPNLTSDKEGLVAPSRDRVFTGLERHTYCRPQGATYPCRATMPHVYELNFGKRPEEELYDVHSDPGQMNNLANDHAHSKIKEDLSAKLVEYLIETGDPRIEGNDPWKEYIYHQENGFGSTYNRSLPEHERTRALLRPSDHPEWQQSD